MKQTSEHDLHLGKWLGGAALGALAMYLIDRERGATLRELGRQGGAMLDKVVHGAGEGLGAHGTGNSGAHDAHDAQCSDRDSGRDRQAATATADGDGVRPSLFARALWPASARHAALLGGSSLGLAGLLRRRMPLAVAVGMTGVALLTRALPGQARQQGQGGLLTIEKSIHIDAAPEQVYALWASYDNFPRFMANVVEVRALDERHAHWLLRAPDGGEYGVDAVLTEQLRPRRLAWHSAPGAQVGQTVAVQLEAARGGTLATVRLSYRPPAGAVGEAAATLFGGDPEHALEDDLGRMKRLLEGMPTPPASGQPGDRPVAP